MRAIMFTNNKDEEDVIMLNEDQVKVIREFVPETYFDQERLIKYLNIHTMVGIEVFDYVAKEVFPHSSQKTAVPVPFIDGYPGTNFDPESVEVFVRRIPFNFYIEGDPNYKDENGKTVTSSTALVGEHKDLSDTNQTITVSGYPKTGMTMFFVILGLMVMGGIGMLYAGTRKKETEDVIDN